MSYARVFILDVLSLHTVRILMSIFSQRQAKTSKKARLSKSADDNAAVEQETTPDPEETDADAMLNDPPPQDHDFLAEQVQVDAKSHADRPTSPV